MELACAPMDAFEEGSAPLAETDRTRLRRMPERRSLDRSDLIAILDAGFICHLGMVVDGLPTVLPTTYGRAGDELFVHGSVASRSLRGAREAPPVCVTVTHVDGIVLARSVFEHSMNYRSVMVFGVPEIVSGEEKLEALRVLTEHVVPGQWQYARRPTSQEVAQTTVLRLPLDEVSVKIRAGAPEDGDGPDAGLDVWAGDVPLRVAALAPVRDPTLRSGVELAPHLEAYATGMAARLEPYAR
ncbi:MAG: flavin-nucleotide-binding protein [Acidimicrobiaceae bacterium]|nr:flavin-nucleotide-binding protein [Acidimicrobiaceae bacterium]